MSDEIKDAWPMPESRQKLMIFNAHTKLRLRLKYKHVPLWSFVSDLTSHGSGYSAAICRANGWNPDQDAGLKLELTPSPAKH